MITSPPRLFLVPLVLLSLAFPLLAGEPTVLIETEFSNQVPGEAVVGAKDQDLPLKFPSSAAANAGSSLIAGKEAIGNLKPPFALFQLGRRAENPDAVANAYMNWDLRREGMTKGVFELTATITPLDSAITGGHLIVGFLDGEGQADHSDPPMHLSLYPATIGFAGINFVAGGKKFPFQAEQTYEIKMRFNLASREWSCWVDGDELVSSMPFPPQMSAEAYPRLMLGSVSLSSQAGYSAKPDARYALSKLTLKKLAE